MTVPSELLEKAAKAFPKGLTAKHLSELVASEPPLASGALIGRVDMPDAGKGPPLVDSGKK